MGRPFDRHIRNDELNALVPSFSDTGHELPRLSPDALREAERHVLSCADCEAKVAKYRQLVNGVANGMALEIAPLGTDCPKDGDVDWREVAAGLWPELKARQLILHAALCEHCGPLLHAAMSVNEDMPPQEEKLLPKVKAPPLTDPIRPSVWSSSRRLWQFMRWLVPAAALMVVVSVLATISSSHKRPLSGNKFAEFAVHAHRQHGLGKLALDIHTDSQQMLNEWFRKLPFSLALPASPAAPGEDRPYRLEGARLVQVAGKPAVYIAYQLQTGPAGLVVTPDSVAVASGGVEVDYKKVTFYYRMVEGYKVVTWSLRGRTYALVSQEGNNTQRSCMVCHSAMRDRDLSQTPTPLRAQPALQ